MNTQLMCAALRNTAAKVGQVDVLSAGDHALLRDAAELLRVLARMVDGVSITKSFGPAGDWGYETEIGHAIATAASDGVIYAAVSQRADPAAHARLDMQIDALLATRSSPAETDQRDAQRYRWLRSQHWHDNTIAAVYRPKDAMKLGHDAPAGERLDELIDQALSTTANTQAVSCIEQFGQRADTKGD